MSSQLGDQLEALAQGLGELLRLGIASRETSRPLVRDPPTVRSDAGAVLPWLALKSLADTPGDRQ